MIPHTVLDTIHMKPQPTKTYKVDGQVVKGFTDALSAVAQAVYFMLNTPRYTYEIYSWDYGVTFDDLIGRTPEFVYAEAKSRITEALMTDERIKSVDNFDFKRSREVVEVHFTVRTLYGDFEHRKAVRL